VPVILSAANLPQLDTVRIVGNERKATGRLDEFETRRLNAAATRSITRAEIQARNPVDAWQMITNVPSVKIAEQGGLVIARSMRVETVSLNKKSDKPCYMRAMVDGVLLPEDASVDGSANMATNLANLPAPDQIHGIEVFAGPASIPAQYGGSGTNKWCGLIAVWTR
jgi:outer membrane receptor for ferrienterochelin and colicin